MKVKYLGKKNSSKILDYSPSLLDSVERLHTPSSNYYGIDYWNAYEFSYLNASSQQKLETLEIKIPADSKITVESKESNTDENIFLLELDYGGIFKIENIPDDQLHPFLMIECPRMLFPFVRRVIHDITRDGGYPPLNLDTIDFMAMYRAEVSRLADEQKLN